MGRFAGVLWMCLSTMPASDPTWAKLVRTLSVEFGQDGAFVVG
jgi:hypothetical protein